jgi:hypothetical protein
VEETSAELRFGEPVGRGMEVVGELSDAAEVRLLGVLGESCELEVVEHALTDGRCHVEVVWQGVRKSPLPGPIAPRLRRVPGIDESVGMPMTDEDRRRTLDAVRSNCREAA